MKNKQCENVYETIYGTGSVTDSMICAGYTGESGKGGCFGDSGWIYRGGQLRIIKAPFMQ